MKKNVQSGQQNRKKDTKDTMKKNVQSGQQNRKKDTKDTWTLERIKELNSRSGFQKIIKIINGNIYFINLFIIICTWCAILTMQCNNSIPDFISSYMVNPICTINAALLMVLTNGYNRYHTATSGVLVLTEYQGLQVIDLITTISLLIVTFLQCMAIESFIIICLYGYILTFIRALYLHKHLDKKHPLYKQVEKTWYPNNIRHTITMFIWTAFYYLLLKSNIIYFLISSVVNCPLDLSGLESANILFITRLSFIVVFDIYWIYRVLNKVIVQKNPLFKAQNEKELQEEVEKYYANLS